MSSEQPKQQKQRYKGSCICKKVIYEVDLAIPDPPMLGRCNCTICQRLGMDSWRVAPADFHLKKPCTTAECIAEDNEHGKYFGVLTLKTSPEGHRYFCDVCGTTFLGAGKYEYDGQKYDFFSFNAKTLDQPQDGLDLSKFSYQYVDGLNDAWQKPPKKDGPWSGGSA